MTTPCGTPSMRHCPSSSLVRRTSLLYGPDAGANDCCASTVATRVPVSVYDREPVSCRSWGSAWAAGPSDSTVVDSPGCQVFAASGVRYCRAVL
jgi:hypothetical protein